MELTFAISLYDVLYLFMAIAMALIIWVKYPRTIHEDTGSDEAKDIVKQGFTSKAVPEDVDVVVIGAGVGGLSTAALLAKEGLKVVVLEQHDQAGGNLHVFEEHGFEFDTGLHYIGGNVGKKGSPLRKMFDYLTSDSVEWAKMDDVYDIFVHRNHEKKTVEFFNFRGSKTTKLEETRAQLYVHFDTPEDKKSIDKFFKLCHKANIAAGVKFVSSLLPPFLCGIVRTLFSSHMALFRKTTHEVMCEISQNQKLISVMEYMWGDYGQSPKTASFAIHAMVFLHFAYGGGYYPVGGPSAIAKGMIRTIERGGGKVLVRAPVSEIIMENGRATGVMVKGKFPVRAARIVSSVGVTLTGTLIPEQERAPIQGLLDAVKAPEISQQFSLSSMFVGIDSKEDLELPATNLWVSSSLDHDKEWNAFKDDMQAETPPMFFISFSSVKDPTYQTRFPNKHSCLVIAGASFEHWEPHEHTKYGKRSGAYEQQKTYLEEACMKALLLEYPQLKGKITYQSTGTPLSNDHFLGNYHGAIYGLQHTPQRFLDVTIHPKTSIPGLFLTGQDVVTCGIVGAAMSGIVTAGVMEPRSFLGASFKFLI